MATDTYNNPPDLCHLVAQAEQGIILPRPRPPKSTGQDSGNHPRAMASTRLEPFRGPEVCQQFDARQCLIPGYGTPRCHMCCHLPDAELRAAAMNRGQRVPPPTKGCGG